MRVFRTNKNRTYMLNDISPYKNKAFSLNYLLDN
jgi:hypothetical protein